MRYTPSLPPLPSAAVDAVEVKPVSYLRAAHVVSERSLTPLVFPRHRPVENAEPVGAAEAHVPEEHRSGIDRRGVCRRIQQKTSSPYDTRAEEDRRHGNRRNGDLTTRIEEDI